MLGVPDGRIGYRAVRLDELRLGDSRQPRPEGRPRGQIEPLVEIQANPQAGLVDPEVVPQPRAEKHDHPRIAVRELNASISLAALARVQRDPRDQELPLRQPADAVAALGHQAVDLGLLASVPHDRMIRRGHDKQAILSTAGGDGRYDPARMNTSWVPSNSAWARISGHSRLVRWKYTAYISPRQKIVSAAPSPW